MSSEEQKTVAKELENGPLEERQCRDVLCCLIFVVAVVGMFICSVWGWQNGNLENMFRLTDSVNVCGVGAAADYKYLYFVNPPSLNTSLRACVKACPSTMSNGSMPFLECLLNNNVTDCNYKYILNQEGTGVNTTTINTTVWGYDTTVVMKRICMPSARAFAYFNTIAGNTTTSLFTDSFLATGQFTNLTIDLRENWQVLLMAFFAAVIISFIFIFLMRFMAGCIVWTAIISSLLFLLGAGFVFAYSGGMFGTINMSYMGYSVPKMATINEYTRWYGVACWVGAGLIILILLCLCNRIRLAVAVCKAAAGFITDVCSVMLVPIIMSMASLILWIICLVSMVFIISGCNFVNTGEIFTSVANYQDPGLQRLYYYIFGTLWCNALINAISVFVVSSACCMWYFAHGPGQGLHLPILRSYWRVFRYHLGSLAFGSFILALVQFIQLVVEFIKKNAESSGADKNKFVEAVFGCLRCFLICLEKIVQFINTNAYIQIALRGKNFCMAAKDGFELAWSNPARYAVVGGIGNIIMFFGRLLITALTVLGVYLYFNFAPGLRIMSPLLMLLIVAIFAYAIGTIFMSVYSLAMDSMLVCFIVDETCQLSKSAKGPRHAPPELLQLMDEEEKKN